MLDKFMKILTIVLIVGMTVILYREPPEERCRLIKSWATSALIAATVTLAMRR